MSANRFSALWWSVIVVIVVTVFGVSDATLSRVFAAEPAVAYSARLIGDEKRSRLVMDFDAKISIQTFYLENPFRVVIELPESIFNFAPHNNLPANSLIPGFRYGVIAPGRSRIVLNASKPVLIEQSSVQPLQQGNRHRLIIDFVKTDIKTMRSAMFKQNSDTVFTGAVAYKGDRVRPTKRETGKFLIALDPGHGGIDGGARGRSRTMEKEITLSFSRHLTRSLERTGLFKVISTRTKDVFVSLNERVATARRNQADLFLSIHADSLNLSRIRGATVYTLSKTGSDELSMRLAESENRSDLIAGLSLPRENAQVTDILIDLTRRETKIFSVRIADLLVQHFQGGVTLIKNPHRSANFHVLKAPEVPSILLELGYLSNRQDEKLMQEPDWQKKAAKRVTDAMVSFFRQRMVQKQ